MTMHEDFDILAGLDLTGRLLVSVVSGDHRPDLRIIDEAGTPHMTIVLSCLTCEVELQRQAFDMRDPDRFERAGPMGEEQGERWVAHLEEHHAGAE